MGEVNVAHLSEQSESAVSGPRERNAADLIAKPLLSIEEAANLLGESRSTLYRAIASGRFPLPVYAIGGRMRIPRRAVERLIEALPMADHRDDDYRWEDGDTYVWAHRKETATRRRGRVKVVKVDLAEPQAPEW